MLYRISQEPVRLQDLATDHLIITGDAERTLRKRDTQAREVTSIHQALNTNIVTVRICLRGNVIIQWIVLKRGQKDVTLKVAVEVGGVTPQGIDIRNHRDVMREITEIVDLHHTDVTDIEMTVIVREKRVESLGDIGGV